MTFVNFCWFFQICGFLQVWSKTLLVSMLSVHRPPTAQDLVERRKGGPWIETFCLLTNDSGYWKKKRTFLKFFASCQFFIKLHNFCDWVLLLISDVVGVCLAISASQNWLRFFQLASRNLFNASAALKLPIAQLLTVHVILTTSSNSHELRKKFQLLLQKHVVLHAGEAKGENQVNPRAGIRKNWLKVQKTS